MDSPVHLIIVPRILLPRTDATHSCWYYCILNILFSKLPCPLHDGVRILMANSSNGWCISMSCTLDLDADGAIWLIILSYYL
jgi:hypothetical protein